MKHLLFYFLYSFVKKRRVLLLFDELYNDTCYILLFIPFMYIVTTFLTTKCIHIAACFFSSSFISTYPILNLHHTSRFYLTYFTYSDNNNFIIIVLYTIYF
eukprot:UN04363